MNINSPFEYKYNQDIKQWIKYYLKHRQFLGRIIGLSELYFPIFEETFSKYDVPLELKYLAVVESALNPNAKSRAGAVGLWQFMYRTGLLYDLNVTSYVDDRKDPYKSTEAAARHMRDLYDIYHDWALVLAAYNAGENYLKTKINEQYTNNFWDLVINSETARYISRAIATKIIYQSLKNFGFYIPTFEIYPQYKYKEIVIDSTINNLPLFCNKMGISYYNFKK